MVTLVLFYACHKHGYGITYWLDMTTNVFLMLNIMLCWFSACIVFFPFYFPNPPPPIPLSIGDYIGSIFFLNGTDYIGTVIVVVDYIGTIFFWTAWII